MKKILFFLIGVIYMFKTGFNLDAVLNTENTDPYFDTTKYNTSIIYTIQEEDATEEQIQDLVAKLNKRIQIYYVESEVLVRDEKEIIINMKALNDPLEIMDEIIKPAVIEFLDEESYENKVNGRDYEVLLDGFDIESAQAKGATSDMGGVEYVVMMKLTEKASQEFEEYTKNNIGKLIYVMYDDEILTAPYIYNVIPNGEVLINGIDTVEESEQIASFIRIGRLPLTLEIKEIIKK